MMTCGGGKASSREVVTYRDSLTTRENDDQLEEAILILINVNSEAHANNKVTAYFGRKMYRPIDSECCRYCDETANLHDIRIL